MNDYRHVAFDETAPVDERQLRLLMRDWRGGRATRTLLDVLGDGYVMLVTIAVIGGMAVSAVLTLQRSSAGCTTAGCLAARGLSPWLMVVIVALIATAASRLFGPVVASGAEGFFLLEAPLRRTKLLAGRLWALVGGTALLGAVVGFGVALVAGNGWVDAGLWAAVTGAVASAVVGLAAANQSRERPWVLSALQTALGAALVVLLIAIIAMSVGWLSLGAGARTPPLVLSAAALAAAALAGLGGFVAHRRLEHVRRFGLVNGGNLVESVQGAAFGLDFGGLRDVLVERHWRMVGNVRPMRGRGAGQMAIVNREFARLRRNPRPLVMWAVSAIVPYAFAALGLGNLAPTIIAAILFPVMVPFLGSMRVLSHSRGLARCFPYSKKQLNDALLFVPMALVGLWAIITMPAFVQLAEASTSASPLMRGIAMALATAAAGLLAAVRWITGGTVDFSAPMMSTAGGAVPPTLISNMLKGFDIVALVTLPMVLGMPSWVPGLIVVIVWAVLRMGGINMADMAEKTEELKREAEEEKAKAQALAGTKKKVVRPAQQRPVAQAGNVDRRKPRARKRT